MHRSGTSLVARILGECGLFLGPSEDLLAANEENREGFWENRRFVELNDELLAAFGGTWDAPPTFPTEWERTKKLGSLRRRARELVKEFEAREPWGWKDPRNSLTIRFWRQLVPGLKVVHCVRNPLEVADSLERWGNTSERSHLDLWLAYNRELVSSVPADDRIVTHYDSFFTNGEAEVVRLTGFLGLDPEELQVAHAATALNEAVRHHQAAHAGSPNGLPAPVARCYAELCGAAKGVAAKSDAPA